MNDFDNYNKIIYNIFNQNLNHNKDMSKSNSVIGALNNNEYSSFRNCFESRLKRLGKIYSRNNVNRKSLFTKLKDVASNKNWEGAISELIAFDYLNRDFIENKDHIYNPICLDKDVPNEKTFANELGKSGPFNLDGYFEENDVYFDIKSFKNNVSQILNGIFNDVKSNLPKSDFFIMPEYPGDISYVEFKDKRAKLKAELLNIIEENPSIEYIKSEHISELSYRLRWTPGLLITEGSFNPYEYAENYHRLAFIHVDKYIKDRPSFLVFVVFPWFNGIINDFRESNKIFYRAFSRRCFCQYKDNSDLFKSIMPQFIGSETIYDISRYLSGILFLEDHSITCMHSNYSVVKSYFYINPNAKNSLMKTILYDYCIKLGKNDFDDFEHDNY